MRTWGVPLRRPEGVVGTDGQVYSHHGGKYDRTARVMVNEDDADAGQSLVARNMEPVRAPYTSNQAPSFQTFQQRGVSPGERSRGSDEDTDYEHVRFKTGSNMPAESLTRGTVESSTGNNAFRSQVERNQSLRDGDEQDLAYQRPSR